MKIERLRVQHFRNHDTYMCDFSPHTTLIYGKNGTGKTALLEAIYEAYRGTSFKGTDGDIVNNATSWYRVDLTDSTGLARTVLFDNRAGMKVKQFTIDNKKSVRMPAKYKRPIILFTPNDLRLVDGSPARRREYLDSFIAQYDPRYTTLLRRYERALLQRNKLLKSPSVTPEKVFSWNLILSETGAYIVNARVNLTHRINDDISRHYQMIAKTDEMVSIGYTSEVVSAGSLLTLYEVSYERDHMTGSTSIGPHRHDLVIALREKRASDAASRGEVRTMVLALKYIEAEVMREKFEDYPLILLDDVYGELDHERRRSLTSTLSEYQIVITSTDKIVGLPRNSTKINLS